MPADDTADARTDPRADRTGAPAIRRLLVTGAAGALGSVLRGRFAGRWPHLRLTDIRPLGEAEAGEELVQADLADFGAVRALAEGVDAIVHLGAQPVEHDWQRILSANIVGTYNVFEAARQAGVARVVFASSNHATGFHRRDRRIGPDAAHRPDTRYGLSKAFGEDLGRLYADKWALSVVCLRIGSCFATPTDARTLSSWLSHRDFGQLVEICLTAPGLHFEVMYGVSDNPRGWWDISNARRLGYAPQDSAEAYADLYSAKVTDDPVEERFQGGSYCAQEFGGDLDRID